MSRRIDRGKICLTAEFESAGSDEWLFPEAHVVVLPRTHSDHNPILIDSADYFFNFRQLCRFKGLICPLGWYWKLFWYGFRNYFLM